MENLINKPWHHYKNTQIFGVINEISSHPLIFMPFVKN